MNPSVAQDTLLSEYVNAKLFEKHVKARFDVEEQQPEPADFTEDDLNALRYAAGYVTRKLKQKYQKPTCKHANREGYLVCLVAMNVSTEEDNAVGTYLEFTKRWICGIEDIDHGELFHINDAVYSMKWNASLGIF